jgi:hypothetical protein
VGVAPLPRAPGVAPPLVGDADAPGERHLLVADQHLAVAAAVGLPEPGLVDGAEPLDLGPGRHHPVDEVAVHADGADGVEDHANPHAGRGPVGEEAGQLGTDRSLPVDEGQEVDRGRGLLDGLEHGREDPVAVAEDVDPVALGGRHPEQPLEDPAVPVDGVGRVNGHWWSGARRSASEHVSPSPFRTVRAIFRHTAHRRSSGHGYAAFG